MVGISYARCTAIRGKERHRALLTQSRETWKMAYAVSFTAFFLATIAFQHNPQLNHQHRSSSVSRSNTALRVLMEPMNIVKVERKQSVEDRAALEELYMVSSLAKKASRKRTSANPMVTRKRKRTSFSLDSEKERNKTISSEETRMNRITSLDDSTTSKTTETNSSRKQTQNFTEIPPSLHTSSSAKTLKNVRFKGLTTVPNRRNKKKKKSLVGSLSERIAIDQDEYIHNLLKRKEELLSYDSGEILQSSTTKSVDSAQFANIVESRDFQVFYSNSKPLNLMHNGRSSTMPGFKKSNTLRMQQYLDGIKVAKRNTSIEFSETTVSRKKRVTDSGQSMYMASRSVPESLVQFANEIHSVDRITPEEEIVLGKKTQEALRLQRIYDSLLTKLNREPTDDEWCAASGKFNMEAIAQIIDEGLEAKNKLVTSNLRMVQGVVNVYIRNGLQGQYNAGDLMQEGILALMRAAEKFDPSRGFRFSTYAMYWIRSAIKRDHCSQSRIIQVPHRLHETHKKITVNKAKLREALQRPPTAIELSKEIGMSVDQIERCETAFSQEMFSLDQNMVNRHNYVEQGRADTLSSIISSKTDDVECNDLELHCLREDLLRALKIHLTKEEADILILKFGLDDDFAPSKKIGRSVVEVGKMVNLKTDKVRRIIKKSLTELEAAVGDEFRLYNRDFCI